VSLKTRKQTKKVQITELPQKPFGRTSPRRGYELEVTTQRSGSAKRITLYRRKKKCSAVRTICIVCLSASIHKMEKNHPFRVCKACLSRSADSSDIRPARAPASSVRGIES
jgi:hypothetical protein